MVFQILGLQYTSFQEHSLNSILIVILNSALIDSLINIIHDSDIRPIIVNNANIGNLEM